MSALPDNSPVPWSYYQECELHSCIQKLVKFFILVGREEPQSFRLSREEVELDTLIAPSTFTLFHCGHIGRKLQSPAIFFLDQRISRWPVLFVCSVVVICLSLLCLLRCLFRFTEKKNLSLLLYKHLVTFSFCGLFGVLIIS